MTAKKKNDPRTRELLARQRAAKRAQRRQQAAVETANAGLRHIVRWPELEAMTGRSRSSIQEDIIEGRFPKPIPLGGRAIGWLVTEVENWIAARIAERDPNEAA